MIQKDLPGDWISKPGRRGEWSVTIVPSCLRFSGSGSNPEDRSPSQPGSVSPLPPSSTGELSDTISSLHDSVSPPVKEVIKFSCDTLKSVSDKN